MFYEIPLNNSLIFRILQKWGEGEGTGCRTGHIEETALLAGQAARGLAGNIL
jgi:hypothetical protein